MAGRPMMLGETYFWMEEFDKALTYLKKAQEMDPSDAESQRIG
jgi:cytochrome c-type biogenesis protein CcmH/NrfG